MYHVKRDYGNAHYICGNYQKRGAHHCSRHPIREKYLEQTILHDLKKLIGEQVDTMPKEISDHIFGGAITEDIGRILATVYNGEIDLLLKLIENAQANEYARGQALIALVAIVFNGQLSRE